MKHSFLKTSLMLMAAMSVAACKSDELTPSSCSVGHSAKVAVSNSSSRTEVVEGGDAATFRWSAGDEKRMNIYENGVKGTISSAAYSEDRTSATLNVDFGPSSAASFVYSAVYANSISESGVPQLSALQMPSVSSFDASADILVSEEITASAARNELSFSMARPVVVVKMTLEGLSEGEKVSSVTITMDKNFVGGTWDGAWTGGTNTLEISYPSGISVQSGGKLPVYFLSMPVANAAFTRVVVDTDRNVYTKDAFSANTLSFTLGKMKRFSLSVDGYAVPHQVVPSFAAVPYAGGEVEFTVSGIEDWTVSASDSFVGITKTGNSTFKATMPYSKYMAKKTFTLTVTPSADAAKSVSVPISIAPASYIDNSNTAPYTLNEDGSVTLTSSASGNLFMKTLDQFKYGNFVWTFSEFNLAEGFFSVNNWQGSLYLMLKCGLNANLLACGGTFTADNGHNVCFGFDGGWDNCWNDTKQFTADTYPTDVTKITSIRMLIKPTERTGTKQNKTLSRKVWVNGVLVLDNSTNVGDVWAAKSGTPGFNYQFGIQEAVGRMTISSFEIDPDYTKYSD